MTAWADSASKQRWADKAPKRDQSLCGQPAPERRAYPNGKQRPVDKCNRVAGHAAPHRLYDAKTFRVILEWEGGASS